MSDDHVYHVDGELVPAAEATVSVRDRGFTRGDAAFEAVRVYAGTLFEWEAHVDRLANTCERISLDHGIPDAELRDRVEATLSANDLDDARVRLSIIRGVDEGGITPPTDVDPTVVVTVAPLPRGGLGGERPWDGPATLQTVKTRRVPDRAVPADAKTHSYINGVLAQLELRVSDADEALVLDMAGNVAEGATSNVFFVDDRALHTPSLDGPVLPGVTRSLVIDLAGKEGIPVEEGTYTPDEVRGASEVFLTGTSREVHPVETVDGVDIAGGPVTPLLSKLYDAHVEETCYD